MQTQKRGWANYSDSSSASSSSSGSPSRGKTLITMESKRKVQRIRSRSNSKSPKRTKNFKSITKKSQKQPKGGFGASQKPRAKQSQKNTASTANKESTVNSSPKDNQAANPKNRKGRKSGGNGASQTESSKAGSSVKDDHLKLIEKEKEVEEYEQWLIKEDEFLKKQLVEQSKIRINLKRMKPIDHFAKILYIFKGVLEVQEEDSVELFKRPGLLMLRMNKEELNDVIKESEVFLKIEDGDEFRRFWKNIKNLATSKLEEIGQKELQSSTGMDIEQTIAEEYKKEINNTLKDKDLDELASLESQARKTIKSSKFKINTQFWEEMLKKISFKKSELELVELYMKHYEKKIDKGQEKMMRMHTKNPKLNSELRRDPNSPKLISLEEGEGKLGWIEIMDEDAFLEGIQKDREEIFGKELEEMVNKMKENLQKKKKKDLETKKLIGNDIQLHKEDEDVALNGEEEMVFQKFMKAQTGGSGKGGAGDDEVGFDAVFELEKKYDWIEKFRPRKPHYFNRVKMGYEWNKVNQTRYGLEDPPPKEVLGYKFNIFYPNLIDKSKTPSYTLEPTENHNFCTIKFTAGPPYEDIAFKIVNKEWNLSDRHGFKCVFDRGILHLHFNFVKVRYRR